MPSETFRSFKNTHPVNPFAGATGHDVDVAEVAIEAIRLSIESDEIGPTKVVAGGPTDWRNIFMREMQSFRLVDAGCADLLFEHFSRLHAKRFGPPKYPVYLTPAQVLDNWHEASPTTQAEINAAWKVESASSDDARKRFYGPDGNPDNLLKELVDADPVT